MIANGYKINGRYQIIKTIGEGGMANVYLAQDTILDRNVAVKVLRGDLAEDEKFIRRFQREALSASKLIHPNIVEMYDVGEEDGSYYIVMEYINGKTLKNLIKRRGALTLPEVIDIMTQLLSAIMCAHDSYIIHRDIKPQNVLILDDGSVKITDFGIAVALNSNELTQTNSVMGSVHYLPPEQANGSGSTIKSDIYSLGILMYELLTGKVPFRGENAVEIAIKQMREPIPSVCEFNSDIPQSIENIILRACAKNPKNRYDSANEMYSDLKNALTEDALKQNKITYKYSEADPDDDKVIQKVEEKSKKIEKIKKVKKEIVKEDNMKKKKSALDIILLITGLIFALLIALLCIFAIVYPQLTAVPEIKIPDVSNLTIIEAENILKEKGLNISIDLIEKESDTVEASKVINTSPATGKVVKEGTEVTLIIAKESGKVIVRDYTKDTRSYKSVERDLVNAGLQVELEPKKIYKEEQSKYKENRIVEQSVQSGTKLSHGDTIVLYYAVYVVEYPNFKEENYFLEQVQSFCDKYNVNLKVKYEVNDELEEGTVIAQDRTGEVSEGTTLTVTVTKKSE